MKKQGGFRKNSGRKKEEPTKPLYRRIPESIYDQILRYVEAQVKYHKSKSTKR